MVSSDDTFELAACLRIFLSAHLAHFGVKFMNLWILYTYISKLSD